MPIYEFFCPDCNTLFNFFSRSVDTTSRPRCPRCRTRRLDRRLSPFAVTGRAREEGGEDDLPIDENRMAQAMASLAGQAEGLNEDDPRQAAQLMRRLSDMTGLELGQGMHEALARMERGEDPEQIEAEMGDALENEDPLVLPGRMGRGGRVRRPPPERDDTLYDLQPPRKGAP